ATPTCCAPGATPARGGAPRRARWRCWCRPSASGCSAGRRRTRAGTVRPRRARARCPCTRSATRRLRSGARGRPAPRPPPPVPRSFPRRCGGRDRGFSGAMRVAFLSASGELGGAERVLLDLLAALRQAEPGWELHLVAGTDGPLPREAARRGVAVHPLPLPAALSRLGDAQLSAGGRRISLLSRLLIATPAGLGWLRRLRALLRGMAPGVVHTNGFKVHVLGALALPPGARLVWHVHDYTGSRRLMSRAMRRLCSRCDAAFCLAHSVARDLRAACGDISSHVVHNAVDLTRFTPAGPAAALDELAGLPPAPADVVRVGLVATM